jgi:hypothetical protein
MAGIGRPFIPVGGGLPASTAENKTILFICRVVIAKHGGRASTDCDRNGTRQADYDRALNVPAMNRYA